MKLTSLTVTGVPQVRSSTLPAHQPTPALPDTPGGLSVAVTAPSAVSRVMSRWRWRASLWSARLGLIGRLGLGLAALGATFYVGTVVPGQSDLQEGQGTVSALRERVMQEAGGATLAPAGSGEELDRFYQFIPPDSEISQALRQVYRISVEQGLQLEQAEYRLATEGQGRLLRYEVAFPVVGTYPHIRLFLRQVSSRVPFAVPDKVNFEYQDPQSGQVRATIRLLLYSRKDS
jgi:hypothetical protein